MNLKKLTDYLKPNFSLVPGSSFSPIGINPLGGFGLNFTSRTQQLPNDAGNYQTPVPLTPTPNNGQIPFKSPNVPPTPIFSGKSSGSATSNVPPQYINPKTGGFITGEDYANNLANVLPNRPGPYDIGRYAGNALTNPNQSVEQLNRQAYGMNNARNDIATGETDPYKVASQSGIQYSPAQLSAIEKAYAGVYDPALSDVFTKLEAKQKADEEARTFSRQLALKNAGSSSTSSGTYTPGANPAVDAWAARIQNNLAKITDIPASQKGMRDMVTIALQSGGNQTNGKPSTTELGQAALVNAKTLMDKFNAGSGTSAVGMSRLLGYGAFPPPGTAAANFTNDFNAIKSQLSLDAVKYLKGQGSVSDAERALLAQAVTKLNLSQSEDEFKTTLQGIIDKLEGNISSDTGGSGGGNIVTAPDGTQVELTD